MLENLSTEPFSNLNIQDLHIQNLNIQNISAITPEPNLPNPNPLNSNTSEPNTERPQNLIKTRPLYFLCVNYHSAALVSDLMHTLEDNQGIVIINNSPADKAIHALQSSTFGGGEVTVIDAPNNGGFGAGCNLGLQWIYARSPQAIVWVINPDASIVSGAIAQVRRCLFNDPSIAILGTPVLDSADKLWFGSGRFNRWTGSVTSHIPAQPPKQARRYQAAGQAIPTRWVTGCSIIFNLALLEHCPQFDETYFLYYEDCDLCERYFQQGYAIAILPMPLVVHTVSSITSRYIQAKFVHGTFSKLTFLRRHATPLALGMNLLYLSARAISETFSNPLAAKGRWQGIWQFLQSPNPRPYVSALDPKHYRQGNRTNHSAQR